MAKKDLDGHGKGLDRRHVLECMVWAGTGVLWTVSGGVPHSLGLIGEAAAAEPTSGFTFLQMSDSHIGFDKKANPDALGTLQEAITKVKAMPTKPAFIIHTGDITHLSKPTEFDNADKVFGEAGVRMHWVPGEHDLIDEERGKAYLDMVVAITRNTKVINYLGLPAISVPCGFTASGLPTSFQLVGRPLHETALLRAADRYQHATDWHRQEPETI